MSLSPKRKSELGEQQLENEKRLKSQAWVDDDPTQPMLSDITEISGGRLSHTSTPSKHFNDQEVARISGLSIPLRRTPQRSRTPSISPPTKRKIKRDKSASPLPKKSNRRQLLEKDNDFGSSTSPSILNTRVRKNNNNRSPSPNQDDNGTRAVTLLRKDCIHPTPSNSRYQLHDLAGCIQDSDFDLVAKLGGHPPKHFQNQVQCFFHNYLDHKEWSNAMSFPSNSMIVQNDFYSKQNLTKFIMYLLVQRFYFVEHYRNELVDTKRKLEKVEIERNMLQKMVTGLIINNKNNKEESDNDESGYNSN